MMRVANRVLVMKGSAFQGKLTLTSVVKRRVKICSLSSVIIVYLRICLLVITKMFWNGVGGMFNLVNKSAYQIAYFSLSTHAKW